MLVMYIRRWRLKIRCQALAVLAALSLALLSGCTAGLATKPSSSGPPQPVDQEPSIARFENGWEGFMIIERAQLDDVSRSEFDSSVAMFREQAYEQAIGLMENVTEQ